MQGQSLSCYARCHDMSSGLSCFFYYPYCFIGPKAQTHVTVRNCKERAVPVLNTGKYPR